MSTSIYPVPNAVIPATTTVQGIVQLAGDLGGTASSPTVVSVADVTVGTLAVTNGGTGTTTSTGSGSVVLSASPTLTGTVSGAAATWTGENKAADFKATGLTGATAASRYVGATTSGAPITGTFAVGDYVVDQTGKFYVCTVAGTPGTWVQVGATTTSVTMGGDVTGNSATSTVAKLQGTSVSATAPTSNQVLQYNGTAWTPATFSGGAPGTTVSSFISSAVTLTTAYTVYNITSITLTTGTWLINYMCGLTNINSGSKALIDLFLTTTSASSTGTFTGTGVSLQAFVSGNVFSVPVSGVWSYVAASTTTIYLCALSNANSGQATAGSLNSSSNVSLGASGLIAVRTA